MKSRLSGKKNVLKRKTDRLRFSWTKPPTVCKNDDREAALELSDHILAKARRWAEDAHFDDECRTEIGRLIAAADSRELTDRFYKDLELGTGGMRGILGFGTNRINRYTIGKAAQAVCEEILSSTTASPPSAAISYDSRIMSRQLAEESAGVFAANGIESYIFAKPVPVALLSFCVRRYLACAGVMITASHNPAEYNGFKIYWSDGAQVTPPFDLGITDRYNGVEGFSHIRPMPFEEALSKSLVRWVDEEIEDDYIRTALAKSPNPELCRNHGGRIGVVYTALHGTGFSPCTKILKRAGFKRLTTIAEQDEPDGRFPTVASPNPEDPQALAMAVESMERQGADLAIGTDPDTDRVGAVCAHLGGRAYLSGNQIGALMLHYILSELSTKKAMPKRPYFLKSIVTTPLQEAIAEHFNVRTENTLTGFKWIGRRIGQIEKEQPESRFLFASEESFGYLHHDAVRDKDGVGSVALLCETALHHKVRGKSLVDALDSLYEEFGFFYDELLNFSYEGKEGAEKIGRIMDRFRADPSASLFGKTIEHREDYLEGATNFFDGRTPEAIDLPRSNVIGYLFAGGDRLYLRPSGTEPKIKFYLTIRKGEGTLAERKRAAEASASSLASLIRTEIDNV